MKIEIVYLMIRKYFRRLFSFSRIKTLDESTPEEVAWEILIDNQFMTLATCLNDDPWAAPVWYAIDNQCNLYFVSSPSSKHCQNIHKNSKVSVAIFDSTLMPGFVDGLQIFGRASRIDDNDIYGIGKYFWEKRWSGDSKKIDDYIESHDNYKSHGPKKRKFYKVEIDEIYKVDKRVTDVDARQDVNLDILRNIISSKGSS